ncbi:MAG: hypothetical protein HWD92_01255 [Flavobacteriia bacterium]|nr:hypothetical protein [Flavobacteriia bacterium]
MEEWDTYVIPTGNHYSLQNTFEEIRLDTLAFDLTFDSSAIYQSVNPNNQKDWNKVIGFSDCQSFHQSNSARLGWRWTPNVGIELGAYTYQNDNREFAEIDTIQIGDTVHSRIIKLDSTYAFDIGSKRYLATRGCSTDSVAYWLYPYFGGDEPAHDTVRIYLKFD